MSNENVETVRSIVSRWAEGDYSSVDWADPQIEYFQPLDTVGTRGLEELERGWRDFLSAWKRFATRPERFIAVGDDRVLVLVSFEGRGRGSGAPATGFSGGQLFTLRDGKVVRLALFVSHEDALEAAGLSE